MCAACLRLLLLLLQPLTMELVPGSETACPSTSMRIRRCNASSTCVAAAAATNHAPNQAAKQHAPVHQCSSDAVMHQAPVLLLLLLLLTMSQTRH
jgi:hypothetical protein